jgi:hypothetical protein
MIHPLEHGYAISSHEVWLPGSYATEQAAKYAFRFDNAILQRLQDEVNNREPDISKRVITFEMLRAARMSTEPTKPASTEVTDGD